MIIIKPIVWFKNEYLQMKPSKIFKYAQFHVNMISVM